MVVLNGVVVIKRELVFRMRSALGATVPLGAVVTDKQAPHLSGSHFPARRSGAFWGGSKCGLGPQTALPALQRASTILLLRLSKLQ